MIQLESLTLGYGQQILLDRVSASLDFLMAGQPPFWVFTNSQRKCCTENKNQERTNCCCR